MYTTERKFSSYTGLRLILPAIIGKNIKHDSRELSKKTTWTILSDGCIDMNIIRPLCFNISFTAFRVMTSCNPATSPTSGCRSVGIVRLRTKAPEFVGFILFFCNLVREYQNINVNIWYPRTRLQGVIIYGTEWIDVAETLFTHSISSRFESR
jgi:hypothetical protein